MTARRVWAALLCAVGGLLVGSYTAQKLAVDALDLPGAAVLAVFVLVTVGVAVGAHRIVERERSYAGD